MYKKLVVILLFTAVIGSTLACELIQRERSFRSEFTGVNFNQITLNKADSNRSIASYFYEIITVILCNDSQYPIEINDKRDISGMIFNNQGDRWSNIKLDDIQLNSADDNDFPIRIEPGEEVEVLFRPNFINTDKAVSIRIIVVGSLPTKERLGGFLDIKISPFPGVNYDSLSLKTHLPDLQAKAIVWKADAYLASIYLHLPPKWEPNGNIVAFVFQSTECVNGFRQRS